IGNCGPGLGLTGPAFTWAELPDLSKWVLSFTMLIGRLEIFTVIILFSPYYWRK
ncbi:MAG: potassium transporter TrkG, partial [Bacteroidales bacterium]|nr:potassium transporter TrkG [Bacteroidales bacterium]